MNSMSGAETFSAGAKAERQRRITPISLLQLWYGGLITARSLKADAQLRDHLRGASPEMLRRAAELRRNPDRKTKTPR
jgi:hypothetical protein